MRFDDSLKTVLAADASTPFGAGSVWRQLVDLVGRGRAPASPEVMARLAELKPLVAPEIRAASARALAFAAPSAALVALFADEELAIAAPLLRTAELDGTEWPPLIARLTAAGRSVLRHRRDLPPLAIAALERYRAADFVLADARAPAEQRAVPVEPVEPPETSPEPEETPRFEIADLVARIEAFNTRRRAGPAAPTPPPLEQFHYETDAAGVVRWVDGAPRAAVIGIALDMGEDGPARVDGVAAGALRRRTAFTDARLTIDGLSDAAGEWRISGTPLFDPATGRFTGFRGVARRPRTDENAAPSGRRAESDALRQLVHELRTPMNAIAGFAELIEREMLGEVPPIYRARATLIREHAADLLTAIDDLDLAARIETGALELRPGTLVLGPLLAKVLEDLRPLLGLRGARVALWSGHASWVVAGDERAVERLVARLLAAIVSATAREEPINIVAEREDGDVVVTIDRPAALASVADAALLTIDAEREAETGTPLLGTGFALRLTQNLAAELGGALTIAAERLTLRLPLASTLEVDQASTR